DTPHLVLAGKKGWLSDSIYKNFSESGLQDKIHFPGYIASQDLGAVLQRAWLFVFPSLYEGFGLPIVEAMASGVPVIAANASSIPEVAGDAALLVDPQDAQAWAEAIAQVLRDERLRTELVARGKERAKSFTWQKCAEQTFAVLEKVGRPT
ncbi:MAG: glycosyltransferase family 4 protein, partial [Chloroflexi bacterium]|nr:glycosyltransferase family 4 protein [Chloroflexota bacterium]